MRSYADIPPFNRGLLRRVLCDPSIDRETGGVTNSGNTAPSWRYFRDAAYAGFRPNKVRLNKFRLNNFRLNKLVRNSDVANDDIERINDFAAGIWEVIDVTGKGAPSNSVSAMHIPWVIIVKPVSRGGPEEDRLCADIRVCEEASQWREGCTRSRHTLHRATQPRRFPVIRKRPGRSGRSRRLPE